MKAFANIMGYLSISITIMAILFELMHWPGAGIMLVLGVGLINFGYLPLFFYQRYKMQA